MEYLRRCGSKGIIVKIDLLLFPMRELEHIFTSAIVKHVSDAYCVPGPFYVLGS